MLWSEKRKIKRAFERPKPRCTDNITKELKDAQY
jgi:hypothetical protein